MQAIRRQISYSVDTLRRLVGMAESGVGVIDFAASVRDAPKSVVKCGEHRGSATGGDILYEVGGCSDRQEGSTNPQRKIGGADISLRTFDRLPVHEWVKPLRLGRDFALEGLKLRRI